MGQRGSSSFATGGNFLPLKDTLSSLINTYGPNVVGMTGQKLGSSVPGNHLGRSY